MFQTEPEKGAWWHKKVIHAILREVRRSAKYIVSDDHRFVYCIVQKAACSSVKTALLPLFNLEGAGLVREDLTTTVHSLFADSGYLLRAEGFLGGLKAGRYDSYFKFAFVRDPWDRLVSCYLDKFAPDDRPAPKIAKMRYKGANLYKGMSFREFAEGVCEIPDEEASPHFRSQYIGLTAGVDGRLLPDFVGRFESLREDFAHVARKIGAPGLALPHLTPSLGRGGRHHRDFYDEALAQRVGERFRRDIELFGYSF